MERADRESRSKAIRTLQCFPRVNVKRVKFDDSGAAQVMQAYHANEPLLVRGQLTSSQVGRLHSEWDEYVQKRGHLKYKTAGHKKKCPLSTVWNSDMRLESGVHDRDPNPVKDWLQRSVSGSVAREVLVHRQSWIDGIAKRLNVSERAVDVRRGLRRSERLRRPSFITGRISDGGGPTHFDDYHNLAMVITGHKIFYTAKHGNFCSRDIRGQFENERLGVNPYNSVACAPGQSESHMDHTHVSEWAVADMRSGDILFLPAGHWHWVWSTEKTVMTNSWVSDHCHTAGTCVCCTAGSSVRDDD